MPAQADRVHSRQDEAAPAAPYTRDVDTLPDAAWEQMLGDFSDAHYDQTACCIGRRGEASSHLLLRAGGVPVAGARVGLYTLPALHRGLALVRFGPFWRRKDRAADETIYRAVIAALVDEYCVRRGHCLTVRPRPNPDFYARECAMLGEMGFVLRRPLEGPERYFVNVRLSEDAQLKSLGQKWRYNLRKALGNGFDIRLCDGDSGDATFQRMFDRMIERKGLKRGAIGMAEFADDLPRLPEPIRTRTVLAHHDGRPIAGATVGLLGDTAYYVLGATDDAALAGNAGYALQWWIVRWLSTMPEVRWYDLGGANDPGLLQFKQGLVGKDGAVVTMNGEYDRWTSVTGRLSTDLIFAARAMRKAISARL